MQLNGLDILVGRRLKARREALGMSRKALAAALGLRADTVAGIEEGCRRLNSRHMWRATLVLGVKAGYFFHDGPEANGRANGP